LASIYLRVLLSKFWFTLSAFIYLRVLDNYFWFTLLAFIYLRVLDNYFLFTLLAFIYLRVLDNYFWFTLLAFIYLRFLSSNKNNKINPSVIFNYLVSDKKWINGPVYSPTSVPALSKLSKGIL